MITSARMSVFLAARSLARSNYGIAAMTTIMMLLIYISLLFLPSLIQGAINRADTQLTSTLTSNIVITPAGHGTSIDNAASYLASIRGTAGVAAATAVIPRRHPDQLRGQHGEHHHRRDRPGQLRPGVQHPPQPHRGPGADHR